MGARVIEAANGKAEPPSTDALLALIQRSLEDDKAIEPVVIDLTGKTEIADAMVVATGTSQRHIAAIADKLLARLKEAGLERVGAEGLAGSDWVLIDAGDVIVHIFRAETRAFYDLERLWSVLPSGRRATASASA